MRLASIDLAELAARAVADYQPTAQQRAIELDTRLPRLVGWVDPARLWRVLDHLLSNAIKYSPAGQPVTVRVDRDEDPAGASEGSPMCRRSGHTS